MRGFTAVIVTLLIAAVVGVGAYELGVAQALGPAGATDRVVYYHPFFWGGFGFLGLLFPLLFLFLIFGLMRAAFGGGRHYYGGWGRYYDPEARLEEWHKRKHEETASSSGGTSTSPPSGR